MPWKRVAAISALVAALLGILLCVFRTDRASKPSLPSPNGYDLLVQASRQLTPPPDLKTTDLAELRGYVAINSNAFAQLKSALQLPCMVPAQPDWRSYVSAHIDDSRELQKAALALTAEGKLAQLENRPNEAAHAHLRAIKLGQEVVRDGAMLNMLTGTRCEGTGVRALKEIVPLLSIETCREIIEVLADMEANRQSLAALQNNEKEYAQMRLGVVNYLRTWIVSQVVPSSTPMGTFWPHYTQCVNETRLLAVRLAVQAYKAETGRKPKGFADLVPKYLSATATNSTSGKGLVFDFKYQP